MLGCGTQFELKNLKAYSTSELVPQVHCLALEEIFPSKEVFIQSDTSERIGPQSIRITEDIKRQLKQIHLNTCKEQLGVNI